MKNFMLGILDDYKNYIQCKWLYWVSLLLAPFLMSLFLCFIYSVITYNRENSMINDKPLLTVFVIFGWLGALIITHSSFVEKGVNKQNKKKTEKRYMLKCYYVDQIFNKDKELLKLYSEVPDDKKEEFIDNMFERELLKTKKEDGVLNGN